MIVQVPKRRRSQRKIGPSLLYCRRAPLAATGLEVAQRGGDPRLKSTEMRKGGGG